MLTITKIVWTKHAEVRQQEWEKKLGITKMEIENLLRNPGQIVPGDLNVQVAQSKTRGGLLRVAFFEAKAERKIVTVYWTSRVEKYCGEAIPWEKE